MLDRTHYKVILSIVKKLGLLIFPFFVLVCGIFLVACTQEKPHEHVYGSWSKTTATCTEPGIQSRACTVKGCKSSETQVAPRLGHDLKWSAQSSQTETTDGVDIGSCLRCTHSEVLVSHATGTAGLVYNNIGKEVHVIGYKGTSVAVTIPAYRDNLPVTSIAADAFNKGVPQNVNMVNIANIAISASVKIIGERAFINCSNLDSVLFRDNSLLETISEAAFKDCTKLSDFIIPDRVKIIAKDAFQNSGILRATIPVGVTAIGESAFRNCKNMVAIDFVPGIIVETIGKQAFEGCIKIEHITLPTSIKTISDYAFASMTKLTTITLNAQQSRLETIGICAFAHNSDIQEFTIPAGVTYVGGYAFFNWVPTQTINVNGFKNLEEAMAVWNIDWYQNCFATIKYKG